MQSGGDRRPICPEREFEDRRKRNEEDGEEQDRGEMSHSLSPFLSTG